MGKTFANLINEKEVSLAIEQLLIAPAGTPWTPGHIDVGNPPPGFQNLGAVVEDTPQLSVTREAFQLTTGIPSVLQFQAIRALSGTFAVSFHTNQNRQIAKALGAATQLKALSTTFGGAAAVTVGTLDPRTTMTIAAPPGTLGWQVGMLISLGRNQEELTIGDMEGFISAVGGTLGAQITLAEPGLAFDPTGGTYKAAQVYYTKVAAGTSKIQSFALLGVADFLDGSQVVHYMKKAQAAGDWTETIRPDANPQVAGTWNLLGYQTKDYDFGTTHLIVAERFYFPPIPAVTPDVTVFNCEQAAVSGADPGVLYDGCPNPVEVT